jgi:hypothetical protein
MLNNQWLNRVPTGEPSGGDQATGGKIGQLVAEGLLHPECERIFRVGKAADGAPGKAILLHKHQDDAIRIAKRREAYVLTTGTGSGKSLSYFIPIIDDVLRRRALGGLKGISAIVVYPMNALCNSQMDELERSHALNERSRYCRLASDIIRGVYLKRGVQRSIIASSLSSLSVIESASLANCLHVKMVSVRPYWPRPTTSSSTR